VGERQLGVADSTSPVIGGFLNRKLAFGAISSYTCFRP
jgi:hypothetical protein